MLSPIGIIKNKYHNILEKINEIYNEIKDLKSSVDKVENNEKIVQEDMTRIDTNIKSIVNLQKEDHNILEKMNDLYNEVKDLKSSIGKVENNEKTLQESMARIDANIKTEIETLYNNCSKMQTEHDEFMRREILGIRNKLWDNDWTPKQNLRVHLFNLAGQETAKYIIEHMPKVPSFGHVDDILPFALEKVSIEGSYLEFGVYSGHTINIISEQRKSKTIYGFDSFKGLPEDWRSGFPTGIFAKDELPKVNDNVELVVGLFDETLPTFCTAHKEKCAFIHIDCDLYSSAKSVFKHLKDMIVSGTIIVFDEYFNYPDWQNGEYKAFQEFISETKKRYEYIGYVDVLEQVAVKII